MTPRATFTLGVLPGVRTPANVLYMNTATAAPQTIAKCRNGHIVKGSWDDSGRNGGWLICPCGARGMAKGFAVTIKEDHRCGLKCTSALGPTCNCSCGGERHGEDHRF